MSQSQFHPLLALVLLAAGHQLGCSKPQEATPSSAPAAVAAPQPTPPAAATGQPAFDQQLIAERLGTGATTQALTGGAVAAALQREAVPVSVDGTPLAGPLRTELAFRPAPEGVALEGSVELLEDEVSPVVDTLLAHGLRAIGLFSRFLYDSPRVLVLRFEGEGNAGLLASGAQSISAVLRDARLRSAQPLSALPGDAPVRGKLDPTALGGVLGAPATASGETVLVELPRPAAAGAPPGAAPLPLLRASFSGSDARAALDGTFTLQKKELSPVLAALRAANVHPVGIVPRGSEAGTEWFALHFRGKGTSLGLVRTLAQALGAREPAAPASAVPTP